MYNSHKFLFNFITNNYPMSSDNKRGDKSVYIYIFKVTYILMKYNVKNQIIYHKDL